MFGHLQPRPFNPDAQQPQQAAQKDQQIVQAFDQGTSQWQIAGSTTITALRNDLNELARTLPSGAASTVPQSAPSPGPAAQHTRTGR